MADEVEFENGGISNFQHHVTLTMTVAMATWHTVVHHSSTSTYIPNFSVTLSWHVCVIVFSCFTVGTRFADGHTYGRTNIKAGFIRSILRSRPKNGPIKQKPLMCTCVNVHMTKHVTNRVHHVWQVETAALVQAVPGHQLTQLVHRPSSSLLTQICRQWQSASPARSTARIRR